MLRANLCRLIVPWSLNLISSIRWCRICSPRELSNPQPSSKTWEKTLTRWTSQTLSRPSESQVLKSRCLLIKWSHSQIRSSLTEVSTRSMPIRKTMIPKCAWLR
jgi:hypothetical protein